LVAASRGNEKAIVTFVAPTNNGGSPITGYEVTASPGGAIVNSQSSPCTIDGLTNGTAYTFTVRAINAASADTEGTPTSGSSPAVVPATTPSEPRSVTAIRGAADALIEFDPPTDDGGLAVTEYTVTATPSGSRSFAAVSQPGAVSSSCAGSPCVVSGLENSIDYTFSVKASNAIGAGPPADANETGIAGPPPSPEAVEVNTVDDNAVVTWSAPASGNGAPITGYTVTGGGQTCEGDAVVAAPETTSASTAPPAVLAFTGSDLQTQLSLVALIALIAGALLMRTSRRLAEPK